MLEIISTFIKNLRDYRSPVTPNFRPSPKIVPASVYEGCNAWRGIVIHHSATADGQNNDWDGIRKYHMSYRIDGNIVDESTFKSRQMLAQGKRFEKPWTDIGYHGGWEMDSGMYRFKLGRMWTRAGAHAGLEKNNTFNEQYLGLCVIGNFDKAAPDPELWNLCLATVREICATLNIPTEKVIGHREVYDLAGVPRQKTCPGTLFDIVKFRAEL